MTARIPGVPVAPGVAQGRFLHARSDPRTGSLSEALSGSIILGGSQPELTGGDWPSGTVGLIVAGPWNVESTPRQRRPAISVQDFDVFQPGDSVIVDGDTAFAEVEGLREIAIVTSFLQRGDGRVLLLKRSDKVGSFRGYWAAVSGFLEGSNPELHALREIREETGLGSRDVRLGSRGRIVRARSGDRLFVVHPFRFRVEDPEITLDWEHTEFDWVDPAEISRRTTVPKLAEVWGAVALDPSGLPQQ